MADTQNSAWFWLFVANVALCVRAMHIYIYFNFLFARAQGNIGNIHLPPLRFAASLSIFAFVS